MSTYNNPILPGFYPDPSVIRVDDTFYLINSSFQFFPGLPIHASKDLINWDLIGNVINRTSQLRLRNATTKRAHFGPKCVFTGGLYAPTLRYHDRTFYIVCTNLSGNANMNSAEDFQPQNFLVTCKNLADPNSFSEPILFNFHGIDPSLFFDDDGKVYMTGSFIHGYNKKPATVIRQAEIELSSGKLLSDLRNIWEGTGGNVPEGPPHSAADLYKKDGLYWLMIAEGGTHKRHMVTIARSKNVWGPFESYPQNPVITHREGSQVTCVGHAELVNDSDGNWWGMMLARRDFGESFPLSRETFMVPVEWPTGEFPCFDPVELVQKLESRQVAQKTNQRVKSLVTLASSHTLYIRDPNLADYQQGIDGISITMALRAEELGIAAGSPTFVGQRQTSLESTAFAELSLESLSNKGNSGLALYKDPFRYASLNVNGELKQISLAVQHLSHSLGCLNATPIPEAQQIRLEIQSTAELYEFFYQTLSNSTWSEKTLVGSVSCADMSGDDFTGTLYGIYGSGTEGEVTFNSFTIDQER